ncbi:alpha/beta fold hydrolase [Phreatobacter sp.]|uniref:alpha/beta fold hydrolase n=1 Tax=Phreatobacter sp. TaxID=1966341 RepID=UPI003F71AE5C
MIPIAFAGTLGRLHLPQGRPTGTGILIVPPHGLEALAAARPLAHCAARFAAAGHAVLRFDLPGTGDALGSDADPDRIEAWTAAIVAAAQTLARTAGTSRIMLCGLRFGALLAARALPAIDTATGLILIDPVVRGRAYARELAMTARAVAEGGRLDPAATTTDEGLIVGGWLTSRETLEAMRGLDLARLDAPRVPTLILHRRGAADAEALAASWGKTGSAATAEEAPGLDRIGLSPTMAVTPVAAFVRALDWIGAVPTEPGEGAPPVPAPPNAPPVLAGDDFVEQPLLFGTGGRLFGILCRPAGRDTGAMPILIVNAGRNPHVGWARLGVDLSRALARSGIASLRMDFGGVGDSDTRPGATDGLEDTTYHAEHIAEVAAGLDALCSEGFPRAVLLGACSGGYTAFQAAEQDPRIAGLFLINTQRFVWREGETVAEAIASGFAQASTYVAKIADARAWKRVLTGQRKLAPLVRELASRLLARARAVLPGPETRRARSTLDTILARGARVELVYSAGDAGLDELARHFGAAGSRLRGTRGVGLTVIPDADHDLTPPAARQALTGRVLVAMKDWQTSSI